MNCGAMRPTLPAGRPGPRSAGAGARSAREPRRTICRDEQACDHMNGDRIVTKAYETADDWAVAAERMTKVPEALASFRAALEEGIRRELVSARRQALACARQAETWGGLTDDEPFFRTLTARYDGSANGTVGATLNRAADDATAAYAEMAAWLRETYAPAATERDAVGTDRYALQARLYCGMDLDLAETY